MPKIKEHKYYDIKLVWRDKNMGLFFGLYYDSEKLDRREDLLEVTPINPSPRYVAVRMANLRLKHISQ
jgi:hypothetical protein